MAVNVIFKKLIRKCKSNPAFFIQNFARIKHPKAGIIPFKLFTYQKTSLDSFIKYTRVIYKKNRQCGISTLSGAYALWYAMFFNNKTILVVSKREDDCKDFLRKNIKFPYEHLPLEFHNIWGVPPNNVPVYNEHNVEFPNGSKIKVLPSGPDTLRSHSSSLNIVDESAFMPHMEKMWMGGSSTAMHGGRFIVISTPNGTGGQGEWYHNTWFDAKDGKNNFYPIEINWWDMNWRLHFKDELNGSEISIEPTAGIVECKSEEEIEKWGKFRSPWLEEQYRELQQKGEGHLFRQEILSDFIGTGGTILSPQALVYIGANTDDDYKTVKTVDYVHPITEDKVTLDFHNELYVWKSPVLPKFELIDNGRKRILKEEGHVYVIGVDFATGEAADYSAFQIIDITTKEQVAEYKGKEVSRVFVMMVDFMAKWYNNALIVPERTGIGATSCQDLVLMNPNVYREVRPSGKRSKSGFTTSHTSKPTLNKFLRDFLGNEDGFEIKSVRLYKQFTGYTKHYDTEDDLVLAFALAFVGVTEAIGYSSVSALIPIKVEQNSRQFRPEIQQDMQPNVSLYSAKGGLHALSPYTQRDFMIYAPTIEEQLDAFTRQLGGMSPNQMVQPVVTKNHQIDMAKLKDRNQKQ